MVIFNGVPGSGSGPGILPEAYWTMNRADATTVFDSSDDGGKDLTIGIINPFIEQLSPPAIIEVDPLFGLRFVINGVTVGAVSAASTLFLLGELVERVFTPEANPTPDLTPDGEVEFNIDRFEFALWNAAGTAVVVVASLDAQGDFRVNEAIETSAFPLTLAKAREIEIDAPGGPNLDFSLDLAKVHMRLERIVVSGDVNASLRIKEILENATF